MVFMMFNSPISALMSIESSKPHVSGGNSLLAFGRLNPEKGEHYYKQKAVYGLINLMLITIGFYKCSTLGLIPNASGDWLEFVEVPKVM